MFTLPDGLMKALDRIADGYERQANAQERIAAAVEKIEGSLDFALQPETGATKSGRKS